MRPVGRAVTRSSLKREVWGSNLGPVKLDAVLPMARHCCNISKKAVLQRRIDAVIPTNSLHTSTCVNAFRIAEPVEVYQVIISFLSLNSEDRPGRLPGYDRIYSLASLSIVPLRQLCSSCWQCDTTRCVNSRFFMIEKGKIEKLCTMVLVVTYFFLFVWKRLEDKFQLIQVI